MDGFAVLLIVVFGVVIYNLIKAKGKAEAENERRRELNEQVAKKLRDMGYNG